MIGTPQSSSGFPSFYGFIRSEAAQVRTARVGGVHQGEKITLFATFFVKADTPMTDLTPLPKAGVTHGRVSLVLSTLALAAALTALGLQLFRNPVAGSLKPYDLRTPRAALRSSLEMDLKGDVQASEAYYALLKRPRLATILDSLEIHREVEWKPDVTILFVTHELDNRKRREVVFMKKDAATGYWVRVDKYSPEGQELIDSVDDAKLKREMSEWRSSEREPW